MPTPAQYAANRLNAQKSQGPTTPQGRARSKMNALRHGLTARVVVLPSEDMDAYNAFSKEIVDSLDPQTPVERQFAQTVADNQWRINRIRSIEDGMLGMGHFEPAGDFDCPSPEIHSAMTASLRQLRELQTERRDREKTEMDDAIRLLKAQQMKGLPFDPPEIGVVHASAQRDLLEDALLAEEAGFNLAQYTAWTQDEAA